VNLLQLFSVFLLAKITNKISTVRLCLVVKGAKGKISCGDKIKQHKACMLKFKCFSTCNCKF